MAEQVFNSLRGELKCDHPLAQYTSWGIGGNAEQFYWPADLADLQNFIKQLPGDQALTWLGLGSNVLIRDSGIKGTVILTLNRLKQIEVLPENTIRAEAGVTCAKLSKLCVQYGFEDGAFFAGIPGTVGGALVMNAGAFGGETWPHVIAVETIDHHGHIHLRDPKEFEYAYRSVKGLGDQYFVAGHFRFANGNSVRAQTNLKLLLQKRNESQPIGVRSCGSVFKNPPGNFAARLIEAAGLKGTVIGDAEVSQKHANFIINRGNATAHDIEQLIALIQEKVKFMHGVDLIPECRVLG
jgi:UDP-N-acetylmuramate dehydrogenase